MTQNLNSRQFIIFVPCYNEEGAIAPLAESLARLRTELQTVQNVDLKVVWVNDASTDKTRTEIEKQISRYDWQAVIHHEHNKNLVGVLETVLHSYWDYCIPTGQLLGIGLLDGDNSHPPAFFLPMIEKLKLGYDVVIASRFQIGSLVQGVPFRRMVYSIGMSYLFRLFGRIPNVRDYSCGFRAYSADIAEKCRDYRFQRRSFACMVELLKKCDREEALVCEVPFILRYDRKQSSSKMRVVKTITETLAVLLGS